MKRHSNEYSLTDCNDNTRTTASEEKHNIFENADDKHDSAQEISNDKYSTDTDFTGTGM